MSALIANNLLPDWFEYPGELIKMVDENLLDIGPWQFLLGDCLKLRNTGLKKRYPKRELVPFARRFDCDDIACFNVSKNIKPAEVIIIHDFASEGWEEREKYKSFSDWLQAAELEDAE